MSPYSKLQYWLDAADSTPDYQSSDYYKYVGKALRTALHQHKDLVAGLSVKEKHKSLYQALLHRDQNVALAILFLLLDPLKYKPYLDQDFSKWNSIPTKLEFDHKGGFEKVVKTFWKYEGAESKSSINGTSRERHKR